MLSLLLLALASVPRQDTPPPEPAPEPGQAPGQAEQEKKAERFYLPRGHRTPLYMEFVPLAPDPRAPVLVLFHEARSSVGEYRPIVPRLRALGYSCLSVDLISGGPCNDVVNHTAMSAVKAGRHPSYLDMVPDMLDALGWAREHHPEARRIAWGSGASAALALSVASEHHDLVDGVIAFSPGEFFVTLGKSATWIQDSAALVECPAFVASARAEENDWQAIFAALKSPAKTSFLPAGAGTHGSRALWPESAAHDEYWAALEAFLRAQFPLPAADAPPKDR